VSDNSVNAQSSELVIATPEVVIHLLPHQAVLELVDILRNHHPSETYLTEYKILVRIRELYS